MMIICDFLVSNRIILHSIYGDKKGILTLRFPLLKDDWFYYYYNASILNLVSSLESINKDNFCTSLNTISDINLSDSSKISYYVDKDKVK